MKSVGNESSGVCQSITPYSARRTGGARHCYAKAGAFSPQRKGARLTISRLCFSARSGNNRTSGGKTTLEIRLQILNILDAH